MTLLRILPLGIIFAWLFLMLLQSFSAIKLGNTTMSKNWLVYCLFSVLALLLVDYKTGFSSLNLQYTYILYALFLIFFNLAIIFDWYLAFPFINRIEHMVSGFLLGFVLFGFFSTQLYFNAIPSPKIRILFIFGIVNIFTVLNEIVELILDVFFKEHSIGPSLFDTNIDLLMNWFGFSLLIILQNFYLLLFKGD